MAKKKKPPATNLLAVPSPYEDDAIVNLADWVEVKALLDEDGNASQVDLSRALEQAHAMEEDAAMALAGDVFKELLDRQDTCVPLAGKGHAWEYPFTVSGTRTLLEVRKELKNSTKEGILYQFLLITSRADMDGQRRHLEEVDPTKVFETLCADILLNYWGGRDAHSGSMIFGTAANKRDQKKKFETNIENLVKSIKEGRGLKNGAKVPGGGDGRLDVVVWRVFADGRTGALVGFGQCKTGIHWKDHLEKLVPKNFSANYLAQPLIVEPMRVYMVPHRVDGSMWDQHSRAGGLLFDRCRIVQYGFDVSTDVFASCKKWLEAALKRQREGPLAA